MNLHILQFVDDCLDCAYLVLVTTYVYFCFGHAILSTLLLILCANSDTINSTISAPCQLHLTASYRHVISLLGSPVGRAILFLSY